MLNELVSLDNRISLFFRWLVSVDSPLVPAVHVLADLEVFLVVALLVGWWLWWAFKNSKECRIQSLDLFYAIGFAFVVYWMLNIGLPMRPRPETISAIPPLIAHLPDNSFPSGHAIFAGASVFAIARFISGRMAVVFGLLAILMVCSRVIAGVHYFGDIFVGSILGGLCAWAYSAIRIKIGTQTPLHQLPVKIANFIRL